MGPTAGWRRGETMPISLAKRLEQRAQRTAFAVPPLCEVFDRALDPLELAPHRLLRAPLVGKLLGDARGHVRVGDHLLSLARFLLRLELRVRLAAHRRARHLRVALPVRPLELRAQVEAVGPAGALLGLVEVLAQGVIVPSLLADLEVRLEVGVVLERIDRVDALDDPGVVGRDAWTLVGRSEERDLRLRQRDVRANRLLPRPRYARDRLDDRGLGGWG